MNEDQAALASFGGTARLFPLPNLVLFPHVVQPLHIFEPRYRRMTADALGGDRLIAPVLLRPGWEEDYDDRPAIESVACLGRVVAHQLLPDGRYNLLLRGLSRVRIVEEVADDLPYRSARVELLPDGPSPPLAQAMGLRQKLADDVLSRFPLSGTAREQLRELFGGEMPLGALCDVLAFALPLPPEAKQALLAETTVDLRAGLLLEAVRVAAPPQLVTPCGPDRKFPPDFSVN